VVGKEAKPAPDSKLQQRLLEAFRIERGDHLAFLREALAEPEDQIDEIYRRVHSLKGAARACGLADVEELAHPLESLIGRLRAGEATWSPEALGALGGALDAIEDAGEPDSAEALAAAKAEVERLLAARGPDDAMREELRAAFEVERAEHLEHVRAILEEPAPAQTEVENAFRRVHSLKGAARACGLDDVARLAHRLEDLFARVRDGRLPLEGEPVDVARTILDAIEDDASLGAAASTALDGLLGEETPVEADSEPEPAHEPATSEPAGLQTMRVSAERFDKVLDAAGQLLTECLQKDRLGDDLRRIHQQAEELQADWDSLRRLLSERARRAQGDPALVRASRKLDSVASRARVLARRTREAERRQRHGSWTLTRLGYQLQDEVRRARMTPAASVFQGFRKMVRDLARDAGKRVDFQATGLQVQADRMVLQALKDPVMHMIRNALSHGVEPPDERARSGKPETARIELHVRAQGNRLHVAVRDDGRGLDRAAVGREAGLAAEQLDAMEDGEVERLVFRPGLSTRGRVTHLSGRGMGLSVVHETVTRLQGEVDARRLDVGTEIAMRVPLAVSTYRMLLVQSGGQAFALPFTGVERLLRVPAGEVVELESRPGVTCDGDLLPIASLAALLGMEASAAPPSVYSLVVVRANARRVAVKVDTVLGERDALLQDLDEPAASLRHLAGAILMEDGAVSLVLQPAELMDRLPASGVAAPAESRPAASEAASSHRVLVVDDSFTTRTLERSILETHGFDVDVAVDGLEAIEKMRIREFDLVITDVEMPRLDGFGLVREIRGSRQLQATPVIIVSSCDRKEDRLRGLELGADAYIVKRRFDHEELLATIGQILP